MRRSACLLVLLVPGVVLFGRVPHDADAGKGLPATNVAVSSGHIVVSTTVRTAGLDTSVYITDQVAGRNFIYRSSIPGDDSKRSELELPVQGADHLSR